MVEQGKHFGISKRVKNVTTKLYLTVKTVFIKHEIYILRNDLFKLKKTDEMKIKFTGVGNGASICESGKIFL